MMAGMIGSTTTTVDVRFDKAIAFFSTIIGLLVRASLIRMSGYRLPPVILSCTDSCEGYSYDEGGAQAEFSARHKPRERQTSIVARQCLRTFVGLTQTILLRVTIISTSAGAWSYGSLKDKQDDNTQILALMPLAFSKMG